MKNTYNPSLKTLILSTILFLSLSFSYTNIQAQTYLIEGNAFLENETDYSGITITLNRVAPSSLTYNINTDLEGYYSCSIEQGIYDILYEKEGYISQTTTGNSIYSNLTLGDITLEQVGLSGNLTDTLKAGEYKVSGNIFVPEGQTLVIEPGTKLKFMEGLVFNINGSLKAKGNINDSIIFTTLNPGERWKGIEFINALNEDTLGYCKIEYSNESGIFIDNSNVFITNSLICHNIGTDMFAAYDGGGIFAINNSSLTIHKSIFNDNSLIWEDNGSGISIIESNISIANSIFYHNGYANSVLNLSASQANIYNTVITENPSIAIRSYSSDLETYNCVISENSKTGLYYTTYSENNLSVYNSNFYNNTDGNFNVPDEWQYLGQIVTTNYNGDDCDAYNNIFLSPMFTNTSAGDFTLQSTSPCIDAGSNDYVITPDDISGNNRIFNGIVDMGAYEYTGTGYITTAKINLSIYPNPTTGLLSINSEELIIKEIKVTDITGKTIYKIKADNLNHSLDISNLTKGLYFISIQTNNCIYTFKIIKE